MRTLDAILAKLTVVIVIVIVIIIISVITIVIAIVIVVIIIIIIITTTTTTTIIIIENLQISIDSKHGTNLTLSSVSSYRLTRKYGPVIAVRLGSQKMVIASSSKAVKEILVTKSADFCGRPQTHSSVNGTLGKFKKQ